MDKKSDAELIREGKRGDQAAITELFKRHYPDSLRLARGILRSLEEAQDSVQAAYFSAFRHLDSFREDATFKTWITRIVMNTCLMRLRDRGRRVNWVNLDDFDENRVATTLASPVPTPEESALRTEIGSAISHAAERLPKPLREAFTLYSGAGLSLSELAAELGLTVAGAKTRLFRAHARMRRHLQPVWADVRIRDVVRRPENRTAAVAFCR